METKNLFNGALIFLSSLYFSCSPYYQTERTFLGYELRNNIRKVQSEVRGDTLISKLNITEYKFEKFQVSWKNEPVSSISSLNEEASGVNAKVEILDGFNNFSLKNLAYNTKLKTNSLGEIEFLLINIVLENYTLLMINPLFLDILGSPDVYMPNHPHDSSIRASEPIGKIKVTLENKPFFGLKYKPEDLPSQSHRISRWDRENYERKLYIYNNFEKLKDNYEKQHGVFEVLAIPTEKLLAERFDERRKLEEEENRKKREAGLEEKRKKEIEERKLENEKKEIERRLKEEERLRGIVDKVVYKNIKNLEIQVVDEDNGLTINGAGISITSNALRSDVLLFRNGFPRNRIPDFRLPFYPNSWDGKNWGDGSYCKINNAPCSFPVYKPATHKIIVKHPDYYQVDAEITPSKDGLEYVVEMSKIGTKLKLDFNIFEGKGKIRKK